MSIALGGYRDRTMDREITSSDRLRSRLVSSIKPLAIVALLLLAGSWLIGLLRPHLDRDRVRTARVERGPIEAVLSASGTVQPAAERVLASPIDGRLLRVLRHPGAVLEVGDPILELDVSASQLDFERLVGQIAQAESRRAELEADLAETLSEKQSQLDIKSLDLEQLIYQEEQQRTLHAQGLVSEVGLKRSSTLTEKARIELAALERSTSHSRRSLEARISSLDAELATLRRERAAAADRLERATTQADQPGVLTWVMDEEGGTVREGMVLARVADLDRFRVEATLSDVHAPRLREGQAAWVVVGRSDRLAARVARVFPAVESGVLRFWLDIDEAGSDLLRANLRVDVLVVTDYRDDSLTLAKGPYISGVGMQRVFVVSGDRAERRKVRIGLAGWDRYEIAEGLAEGDEVVISDVSDYIQFDEVPLK